MKRTTLFLIIIIAFGGILYFFNIGGWDLWNPDEPRYAQVAKEMLSGNGWLVPHLNSDVYLEKPPLFFWSIAATANLLGGMNECAARLPSAVASVLILILTFFIGKRLFNAKVGLFAALILGTSSEFFWLARRVQIDMTLTFFTTVAIMLFYFGFYHQRGRWIYYILAYAAMALGFLTKAHVAVIIPLLTMGGYFLMRREFSFFADRSHLPGLAVFLTIIGGWIALTWLSGGEEYIKGLLYHRTTARFFQGPSHQRPFYYYLMWFPADFMPWTVFLPSALIYGLSPRGRNREFVFNAFWFAVIFIAFSFASGKRELYLLPLYPAAALMIGYLWDELISQKKKVGQKLLIVPLIILICVLALVAGGIPIFSVIVGSDYLENYWEIGMVLGFIAAGGSLFCFLSLRNRRLDHSLYAIICVAFFLGLYITARIYPEINTYKSARPLSQAIVNVMKPGDQLGVYLMQGSEYNYYTGLNQLTRIESGKDLLKFFESHQKSHQRVFCIMRDIHYEQVKLWGVHYMQEVLTGQVGHRRLVVTMSK